MEPQSPPSPESRRKPGRLIEPPPGEQREVIGQWRQLADGTDGERIIQLERTDDPVAFKLVDAAGDAIGRGELQRGLNILGLVVRDYRHSQEAALARQAIDQIRKQLDRGR